MSQDPLQELGDVDEMDAEAIGEPGKRTFRLLIERGPLTVSIWLEKEQLHAVGMVIEQQLARTAGPPGGEESTLLSLAPRFPARPTHDFRVGRLSVGYEEKAMRFVFSANELSETADPGRGLTCSTTRAQARSLATKITQVVTAGRPICPLCGAPMEDRHLCPASNGHAH